jgi:hypothetical protein
MSIIAGAVRKIGENLAIRWHAMLYLAGETPFWAGPQSEMGQRADQILATLLGVVPP